MQRIYLIPLILLFALNCNNTSDSGNDNNPAGFETPLNPYLQFGEYWYKGEAELSTYTLQQARYGEIREGIAILIQVTEPFDHKQMVKADQPDHDSKHIQNVLKYNLIKRFTTGIYDYSQMMSVFTALEAEFVPASYKVAYSNQDWCGQYYTEMLNEKKALKVSHSSYFSTTPQKPYSLNKAYLEDELFNLIRINPTSLPQGEIIMIPGMMASEMIHQSIEEQEVEVTLSDRADNATQYAYAVVYKEVPRRLTIFFDKQPPYIIRGWEEVTTSGGKQMRNKAELQKQLWTPYWNQNAVKDESLRKQLGL
ncbi:hypothetical protein [Algivirga pacifica]|uniref:Septum formation inhibitor Maf n=1 Tax=Algivirga pacifica TaxID=1162670 RepID=A0ABP9D9G8_9BACT